MLNQYFETPEGVWIQLDDTYWTVVSQESLPLLQELYILLYCKQNKNQLRCHYLNHYGKEKMLHQLLMNFPCQGVIDHINNDPLDNRLNNLRLVTSQQNNFNVFAKGYSFNKAKQKYESQIKLNGKNIHLGYFLSQEEAQYKYFLAKDIIHTYD